MRKNEKLSTDKTSLNTHLSQLEVDYKCLEQMHGRTCNFTLEAANKMMHVNVHWIGWRQIVAFNSANHRKEFKTHLTQKCCLKRQHFFPAGREISCSSIL